MVQNQISVLKQETRSKKGFTLIELVIVIAVLAIIAAIAIPTVQNVIQNANKSADETTCSEVESALKTAYTSIQAGQGGAITKTSKVSEVLVAANIPCGDTTTGMPVLKATNDGWGYDLGGTIHCDKTGTTLTGDVAMSTIFTDLT